MSQHVTPPHSTVICVRWAMSVDVFITKFVSKIGCCASFSSMTSMIWYRVVSGERVKFPPYFLHDEGIGSGD